MTSVVLAADHRYLPYVRCSLAQLARFGRRAAGVTLVVPATISAKALDAIRATASVHAISLDVVSISELDGLHARGLINDYQYVSYHTYSKLLLAEALPHLDEVLYLDVDTLIRAPLDDLLAWKLRHPLGAVPELGRSGAHLFGTTQRPYFNAGVLRMSLERLRQDRVWDQARAILEDGGGGHITLQDQDVLNLIFRDRFDSLPLVFNVFDSASQENRNLAVLQDPVIVHFAGAFKPWQRASTSPFAREWRSRYAEASFAADLPATTPGHDADTAARDLGRGRLVSLAKAVLPTRFKRGAKAAAVDVLDRTMSRMEEVKAGLHPAVPTHLASWVMPPQFADAFQADEAADHGLDLLISLPRSGTNALGDAIERSRPEVHWMGELFLGTPRRWRDDRFSDMFPWFNRERRRDMSPTVREHTRSEFTAVMSEHVIEVTNAVLQNRPGRTLIKVFPDQLHPLALQKLLGVFRPRLLILRRDLVFAYVSQLRAVHSGSWRNSDHTDVPLTINDRDALQYAVACNAWIDGVAFVAERLGLHSTWLTYEGLFTTGDDLPQLESFYPGSPMPVDPRSGRLHSCLSVQDRRSDASILELLKAVSTLSAATQAHLFRLPGKHVP